MPTVIPKNATEDQKKQYLRKLLHCRCRIRMGRCFSSPCYDHIRVLTPLSWTVKYQLPCCSPPNYCYHDLLVVIINVRIIKTASNYWLIILYQSRTSFQLFTLSISFMTPFNAMVTLLYASLNAVLGANLRLIIIISTLIASRLVIDLGIYLS